MPCFFIYRTALSEGFEGERAKIETRSRFDRRQKQSGGLFLGRALIALIIQPGDPKTRSIQSYTIAYSLYAVYDIKRFSPYGRSDYTIPQSTLSPAPFPKGSLCALES